MMLLLSYTNSRWLVFNRSSAYLFVNRGFLFKALLEGVNRVLEVTLLVLVLLLDVGVDLNIFDFLVLYIRVQVLVD